MTPHKERVTISETTYAVQSSPGASFTATCSPSASITGPANRPSGANGSVSVYYSASLVPVTLTLPGTTKDSSHQDNSLIGQGCSSTLSAGAATLSDYQWDAGGAVFDQFQVAPDQSWGHATPVPSDQWQQPSPHWHYLQYDGPPITVTCSATASINGMVIGTVKGQRKVEVWPPYYYMGANVGPCTIVGDVVQAGGVDTNTQPGINFTGRVGTPALFATPGVGAGTSDGFWAFLQLCNLDENLYSSTWPSVSVNTGGYQLDNI